MSWNPVIALKTQTNGQGYIPNAAFLGYTLRSMKLDLFYTDSGMEGDQTGGTSPYPNITRWPDGSIDLVDVYFVQGYYGCEEGASCWVEETYMADCVPDRTVDLADNYLVSGNYGNENPNAYDSNLTGVEVEFFDINGNSLGVYTPDSEGRISIPDGAWTFTVRRAGSAVGAVVTFSEQELAPPAIIAEVGDGLVWYTSE